MKILFYKTLTIAVLLIFLPPAKPGQAAGGYKIKIKVNGIKDTVCYLAGYYGPKQYYKDTARVDANGVFVFEGKDELPGGIYSAILPGNTYFEFIVNEQDFYLETDTSNYIQNMKVKGSLENTLFYDHFQVVAALQKESGELREMLKNIKDNKDSTDLINKKLRSINKEVGDYKLKIIRENPQTLLAKIFKSMEDPKIPEPPKDENGNIIDSLFQYHYLKEHYFDNVDFSDERLLRTPVYHSRLMKYMQKMTPQIPDSINSSADHVIEKAKANKDMFRYTLHKIINTYETSKIMGMDAVFVHLAEKYYMTNQAYWVDSVQLYKISERVRKLKPILIGKQAPPIYHIKDRSGKLIPLYSVDAKYLILIFWDPDCGHCKKDMPKIKDVYEKYKEKGVKAYAVCTEVERDKWIAFVDKYQLTWINVADFDFRSPFRELYDISSTPKIFLLDKDKKIIAKQIGSEQLDEILKRRLKLTNGE
ncbi:DUF5106 domain-containing protein [bacterium AH-315-M05]|nr:DUF5106 domain-containing protein [bacterium AH-315-M05]